MKFRWDKLGNLIMVAVAIVMQQGWFSLDKVKQLPLVIAILMVTVMVLSGLLLSLLLFNYLVERKNFTPSGKD